MSGEELKSRLSDVLFWDVDKGGFDVEAYSGQLIQKCLNMAHWTIGGRYATIMA